MARRTFTDFSSELYLRLGNRTDLTTILREQVLNDALLKVANQYEHRELQGTTTGTQAAGTDYCTPSDTDIWWEDVVKDTTTPYILIPGDKDRIESISKPTSAPHKYYLWNNSLYFDTVAPTGGIGIKIWYTKRPVWWGSGTSVLDEVFDQIILKWATKIAFEMFRDLDEASKVGIEISMYASQMNLPVRKQRLVDHRTGIRPRLR